MEYYEEEQIAKRKIRGITDTVSKHVEEDVKYPVVNVILDESVPRYKLQALSRLLKSSIKTDDVSSADDDKSIYVALKTDKIYKPIGRVMPKQVKTLMAILIGLKVELELEKGKFMDAKYIYALSS